MQEYGQQPQRTVQRKRPMISQEPDRTFSTHHYIGLCSTKTGAMFSMYDLHGYYDRDFGGIRG
jgi:hypothetical protein